MRVKKGKKIMLRSLAVGLWLLLAVFGPGGISSFGQETANLKEQKQHLKEVKKELSKHQEQLEKMEKKEKEALQELLAVRKRLKQTQGKLRYTTFRLRENERKRELSVMELREAKEKLARQLIGFQKRLREIWKVGQGSYLEVLFNAQSLSDFVSRSFFFEKIISEDLKAIEDIRTQQGIISDQERGLRARAGEIKNLLTTAKRQRGQVVSQETKRASLHRQLQKERMDYEAKVIEMENNSRQIEAFILQQEGSGLPPGEGTGVFIWPVKGRITSPFGYRVHPIFRRRHFHTGMDIAAPYGYRIKAADSGTVTVAKYWGGYGNAVVIDHGRGISTVYGHLSRFYVHPGQMVTKGDTIGLIGTTGYSTGPHLHFEVRRKGSPVNPRRYLP